MKSARLLVGLVCGVVCLGLFSGCETQRSACEREKRLTERMDEMQVDLDNRIGGVNAEVAGFRSNPPVIVNNVPTPTAMPVDNTIAIDDGMNKRAQLQAVADSMIYEPAPPPRGGSSSGNHIRVPVPARTVQAALKEAGFYKGNVDGKVGRQTVAAITAFQRSQGIKADGIVGRTTWQHLQAFVPAGMSTTRLK